MNEMMTELQDSIRQVLNDQAVAADENIVWQQAVELGWLMVGLPEALGGLELGLAGCCAVQREMGRRVATIPIMSALVSIDAVARSELADRDAIIEQMLAGETAAISLAGSNLVAEKQADGGIKLSGPVRAVPSVDKVSKVLVWAQTLDYLVLVDSDAAGLTKTSRPTWDSSRRLYDLVLDGVQVDASSILAAGDAAATSIRRALTLRDFLLAADALGGADALLEMTIEHLVVREQFGRPLAMFQALKHRCADLKSQTSATEALLQDALLKAGEPGTTQAELSALKLKQFACQAFAKVAEESLQLHGGIGMASEHPCHLYLKRAMLNAQLGRQQDYAVEIARLSA